MIIDYRKNPVHALEYHIFDAASGDRLGQPTSEKIFYADDEAGYYLMYILDDKGLMSIWDERTHERILNREHIHKIPDEFIRIAWERVDRPIVIRLKSDGPPVRFRQFL